MAGAEGEEGSHRAEGGVGVDEAAAEGGGACVEGGCEALETAAEAAPQHRLRRTAERCLEATAPDGLVPG